MGKTKPTYKVLRVYQFGESRTVKTGLSLAQARNHCRSPETDSRTATGNFSRRLTRELGPWIDLYDREN